MNVESFWAKALNIDINEVQRWKQLAPQNSPLPAWGVMQGHLDEANYLEWARDFYGLATVDPHFFTENFNPQLLEKFKTDNWSENILPVAEWGGFLFVACVEPAVNLQWNYPVKFLLASPKSMEQVWQSLQVNSAAIEDTPALSPADKYAKEQAEKAKQQAAAVEAKSAAMSVSEMDSALEGLANISTEEPKMPSPPPPPEVSSVSSGPVTLNNEGAPPKEVPNGLDFGDSNNDVASSAPPSGGFESLMSEFNGKPTKNKNEGNLFEGLDTPAGVGAEANDLLSVEGLDFSNQQTSGDHKQESPQHVPPAMEGLDLSQFDSPSDSETNNNSPLNFSAPPVQPQAPEAINVIEMATGLSAVPNPEPESTTPVPPAQLNEVAAEAPNNVTPLQVGEVLNSQNQITETPASSLAQSKNLKQALAYILKIAKEKGYSHLQYFSYNNNSGQLKIEHWSDNWATTTAQQKVDGSASSFFKVILRTNHPYHGAPSQCDFHDAFFKSWGLSSAPQNITALPVKVSQQVKAIVVLVGNEETYQPKNLTEMETLTKQLSQFLANSGFLAA